MPLHTPCTSICSLYVMGTWGHLYTPYVLESFGGHQYICQAFLCLSVHPFASQFITVIPVAPHHCGLFLYWTACLWMSAMLCAFVPFFVVFSLCLKLLQPQLWILLLQWLLCALVHHLPSKWLPWLPPWWGFQWHQVSRMWFCGHCWHLGTLKVLLALAVCCSSNLHLRCLFRVMPTMHKAYMSLGSLWGTAASAALAAGVSLVSILQAGDWARVSTPATHYFFTYITTTDWHQDSVQHAVLGLSE